MNIITVAFVAQGKVRRMTVSPHFAKTIYFAAKEVSPWVVVRDRTVKNSISWRKS